MLARERDSSHACTEAEAEVVRLGGSVAVVAEHEVVGCLKEHSRNWS